MEYPQNSLLPQTVPDIGIPTKENLGQSNTLSEKQTKITMNLENLMRDKPFNQKHPQKLLHHSLPVTCLKLLDRVLLVASEGPSLLIKMAYLDDEPFKRFQLFPSQFVISGMGFVNNPVLECGDNLGEWYKKPDKVYDYIYVGYVWAGSMGTLVRITRSVKTGVKLLEYVADNGECSNKFFNLDFIPVAAKWLENGSVLALLSVLNYVVIFERQDNSHSPGNFTSLKEVTRIKCEKSETLFSGTIYGNVKDDLRVFAGTVFNGIIVWDVIQGKPCIKHELKCHDGIVFSVEYYANRKLLLSTSDDRTVGVWQFSGSNGEEKAALLHKFYGHDARVWRALSVHGYIISVGESSDVRVNILEDGKEHKTWKAHDGAPIFTCVYDEDAEILYTGGNNGAIRKWPKWWYQVNPRILPFDVVRSDEGKLDVSLVKETGRWSENNDFPKLVVLLDVNHVIVAMESGRIVGLNWEGKQYDLLHDPRCEGYQVIKISPDHKILAVAGSDGHFYLAKISFSVNQSSKANILHAKKVFMTKISWNVIAIIWLDVSRLLVVCFNRAIALLVQESENGDNLDVQFIQTFNLNLPRPGVPAAVEILGKYVVIGDEVGSLHMLRYHKTNKVIEKFENAHKDGCTSLMYHDSTLYSSGRDGRVRSFQIAITDEEGLDVKFIPLSCFLMPFECATGVYVNMGQMLCCGFQKEEFHVYSINERRTLVKILCGGGGGNRKWDFKYGHGEEGSPNASFTFVKEKEIYYTFLPMKEQLKNTFKDGLHSRTINCGIYLQSMEHKIDYITGSEDGSLKWFQWDVANQSILSIESMENHVSSVRSAWKVTTASRQIFLFTGGGRSQLCVYKIDLTNRKLELLKEIILVKTTFKQTEGDVRIMDIIVVERDNDELWCFSACSDGIVRVMYFNAVTNKFNITGLLNGNAHAVMRIQLLKTDLPERGVLIAGVTSNGYFMLWRWNNGDVMSVVNRTSIPEKSCVFQTILRKTALLSMRAALSMTKNGYECYSIVCGGDDCSASMWTLSVPTDSDNLVYTIKENWAQDQCQRGAVVGVEAGKQSVYTLSNDQIIGIWNLQGELCRKVYAGVSDCQGFVVDYTNRCVMCYGKGISWIPLTDNE